MVANRRFALLDLDLTPGQTIPEKVWTRLSRRTRQVLVDNKFVIRPDQIPAGRKG